MNCLGYARALPEPDSTEAQCRDLQGAGVDEGNLFVDGLANGRGPWPRWEALVATVQAGDLVVVSTFRALGPSLGEALDRFSLLYSRRIRVRSLGSPRFDSGADQGSPELVTAEAVLALAGLPAAYGRERAARSKAKRPGPRLGPGRPEKLTEKTRAAELIRDGLKPQEVARLTGLSRRTVGRVAADIDARTTLNRLPLLEYFEVTRGMLRVADHRDDPSPRT